jgi:hypothetical protein
MSNDECRRNDEPRTLEHDAQAVVRHLDISISFVIRHSCFVILYFRDIRVIRG